MRFAFADCELERLFANMPADHAASIRVAEKIGMRRSDSFHNPRNRNILTCLYSCHSRGFPRLRFRVLSGRNYRRPHVC